MASENDSERPEQATEEVEVRDLPAEQPTDEQPTDEQAGDVKGGIWRNGHWIPW